MDVSECVLSAGRAVLDMVEREWQPLSPGELEQRLDQAVEEMLEAELVTRVQAQPPPAPPAAAPPTLYVQLLQTSRPNVVLGPQVSHSTAATAACSVPVEATAPAAAESPDQADTWDGAVVKVTPLIIHSLHSVTFYFSF